MGWEGGGEDLIFGFEGGLSLSDDGSGFVHNHLI